MHQKTGRSPAPVSNLANQKHNDQLAKLSHWKAEGKMGATNGSEAASASFIWEQKGPDYTIKFFGPLGMGGAHLSGNTQTHKVLLKESNGKTSTASSPEELVHQATGLIMPVSGLQYWIKGLAHPDQDITYRILNKAGLLKQLRQNNWEIQYFNYVEYNKGKRQDSALFLPSQLNIANNSVKVKLMIKSWES